MVLYSLLRIWIDLLAERTTYFDHFDSRNTVLHIVFATMDNTDQSLLALLRKNARASLSDLAATLGLSRATIRSRIEKMQARGDILGFTVVTGQELEQAPVRGIMLLGIEGRGADRLVHRLIGLREVRTVHSTNGRWDLIVEIGTETLEAFDTTLAEIRRMDGVMRSETSLMLKSRQGATRNAP